MNKKLGNIFKGDKVIWMVFFFLCMVSVIEVFSASSELTYKSGSYLAPIFKHIGILFVGVFFMVVTLNIKCKYFKIVTPLLLIVSLLSLLFVLFFGQSTNGANRWISLFGIQFQPSEIAKGALILATAQILSATQTEHGADRAAFKYILLVCAFIVPFILVENLSTAALLCFVIFLMMIIGRVPMSQLGKLMGTVMLFAVVGFGAIMLLGTDRAKEQTANVSTEVVKKQEKQEGAAFKILHRMDTWKARIDKFTDDTPVPPEKVDLDKDAQVAYANIAIASSNVLGKGPGNSVERDFLSQAFSDFIYAIIIEEMGLIGAFIVAFLYVILLFRTGRIAKQCANSFPAFLAMGLALLLVTQAMFNMGVAVGWLPVTGQPLPLVSKGGTSSIINCVYIGVILSISRSAKKRDSEPAMGLATNNEKINSNN
jgi:cell division protein FtsW